MTTDAQLAVLAAIEVRRGEYSNPDTDLRVFYRDTWRPIRQATFNALFRDGLVTLTPYEDRWNQGRGQVRPSEAGIALLAEQPDFLAAERLRASTIDGHRGDYWRYSRGSGAIRGQRTRYGYQVKCSCGWNERVNGHKREAETDHAYHLEQAIETAMTEAGFTSWLK